MLITDCQRQEIYYSEAYWSQFSKALVLGRFWTTYTVSLPPESIKQLRAVLMDFEGRNKLHLIADSIRKSYTQKAIEEKSYWKELSLLYWFAAILSFFYDPTSKLYRLKSANNLHLSEFVQELTFTYSKLGYENLPLLNQDDINWIIKTIGKPRNHKTLRQIHSDLCRLVLLSI